jgi:hypothetical protein
VHATWLAQHAHGPTIDSNRNAQQAPGPSMDACWNVIHRIPLGMGMHNKPLGHLACIVGPFKGIVRVIDHFFFHL